MKGGLMDNNRIRRIDIDSHEYPEKLRNIADPPKQLYCMGNTDLLNETSIGVVGSRKYTIYGKQVAMMIGRRLSYAGIPVVSGLAAGIDGYAHQGVVQSGGKAIGVLGSGINRMGPASNRKLMLDVLENDGLIVSEYEPDIPATRFSFPARNRIISGLSSSLIVVEANHNSGALITAQYANEQGRTVYAVPGNINSQFSLGSNLLIRDGAIPLIVVDDAIRDLGYVPRDEDEREDSFGEDEKPVVDVVRRYNGISPDQLAREVKMRVERVNAICTVLEIKGVIEIYGGKIHLAKRC